MSHTYHTKTPEKKTDKASGEAVEQITDHLASLVKTPLSLLDSLGSLEESTQKSGSSIPNQNKNTNG